MTNPLKVLHDNKDNVFRMLYRDKEKLLQLYNALNNTSYDDPSELEIHTLENAIFMNVKNDVSFLVNSVLNLYEQQSSVNPNMPLRDFIYLSRQFEKYIHDRSIYSSKLIEIPTPKFVVFYTGSNAQPDYQILKLSDSYADKTDAPELELKVQVFNINPGHNEALLKKCKTLKEYSTYVDRIRTHSKDMPIEDAVRLTVDECIRDGILSDFLLSQKAEVISMSIFEYNEEIELKKIRADEYSLGLEDGMVKGRLKALISQICRKLKKNKTPQEIADDLEEDLSAISSIITAAEKHAPDYDETLIYDAVISSGR